jgi:putative hemolysin
LHTGLGLAYRNIRHQEKGSPRKGGAVRLSRASTGRPDILFELVIILGLILANAFFAGAEIAIIAVRRTRLRELADHGRRDARAVLALREKPERFLATVQVGITVVSATAAAVGGHSIAGRIAPLLSRVVSARYADDLALAVVVAGVSYLSIVVGELVPKSLALKGAERYALLVGRILRALSWLTHPVVWLLTTSSNFLLKPFGDRTTFAETRYSAEELQLMVDEAMKAGTVHPGAGEIASRALDFPDLTAEDVMIPREQVVMLPRHAPPAEVRRTLLEDRHTRLPIYEGRLDNVVGYVSAKDLLPLAWEQRLVVLEDVMRPPFFVPETNKAVDLLQEMRRRHQPFAIVVDEQGSMSGIVTMEDLVEELVGEIFSENAKVAPETIKREASGTAMVAGSAPVREINRELGLDLPEDGNWSTVAGLCLALTGRIPQAGERIALASGIVLEVVEATPRRIKAVRVHPPVHEQPSPAER